MKNWWRTKERSTNNYLCTYDYLPMNYLLTQQCMASLQDKGFVPLRVEGGFDSLRLVLPLVVSTGVSVAVAFTRVQQFDLSVGVCQPIWVHWSQVAGGTNFGTKWKTKQAYFKDIFYISR